MRRDRPNLPEEGIYRAILLVMVATVVLGVLLAIAGETLWHDPAIGRLGAAMALIGAAIYAFFRWLGIREARRRAEGGRGDGGPADRAP